MIGKALINFFTREQRARVEQFNNKLDESAESTKRLNVELMKMAEVSRKGLLDPGAETDIFAGNAIESADVHGRIRSLEELRQQSHLNAEGFAGFQMELVSTFDSLTDIDSRFKEFGDTLRRGDALTENQRKELRKLTDSILTVKAAQDTLKQTTGELIKAQNRLIQSLPKVPYQDIIELLRTNQNAYKDLVKEGKPYEDHLARVNNQLEIFKIFQEANLKLQARSRQLNMDSAMSFLAGDNSAVRQLKIKKAELKLDQDIHKLNELQLNIQQAQLEQDDTKLAVLLQQRDTQIAMIGDAKALLELEKLRADRMAMTYNDMYKNLESDLGKAIGAGMRGDSSGFAKIGENMIKSITDGIGNFLSEQFIEDIMPDSLKPKDVGEKIQEAGNKHAEAVKKAIEDGAIIHGNVLKNEHQTLQRILNEQATLNAKIADQEASSIEAQARKKQDELDIMNQKTNAAGIIEFMKTDTFAKEAMEHEINTRSLGEQTKFNENRNVRRALEEEQQKLREMMMSGEGNKIVNPARFEYSDIYMEMVAVPAQTAAERLLEIGPELKKVDEKHEKLLGDYLEDYEEFLINSTTSAIESVGDLTRQKDVLDIDAGLKRKKANTFRDSIPGKKADPLFSPITIPTGQQFLNSQIASSPTSGTLNFDPSTLDASNIIYFDPVSGQTVISTPNLAGRVAQSMNLPYDPLNPDLNDITPVEGEKPKKNMDDFSKNLNQFSGVIGAFGALTGKEEATAKIMAKVAKIQLMIAMYERAHLAFKAGGGPLKILSSFIFGAPAGRQGGIMSQYGRSYSQGGVSDGPSSGYGAVLHGREAVVPLPNGRAIPVEMAGGSGATNNTNITVNIDDSGTTSKVDSDGGAELGQAINMAVQNELERQMRPGGILGS